MKKTILLVAIGLFIGSTLTFAATALFFDIPSDAWYRGAALRLADKGIVTGYPDGSFQGDKGVNRAEVATMIDRAVEYSESTRDASLRFVDAQEAASKADVCTQVGTVSSRGWYNPASKTWWFDLQESSHPACSPACIIHDDTKAAEINWRCA